MLLSGDLAVFMQPRCCLPALKPSPIIIKFEDCAKSDFQSPRVPPDTGELARGGAESLSAPTAGWPPWSFPGRTSVKKAPQWARSPTTGRG